MTHPKVLEASRGSIGEYYSAIAEVHASGEDPGVPIGDSVAGKMIADLRAENERLASVADKWAKKMLVAERERDELLPPLATPEQAEKGWTYEYEFLKKLAHSIQGQTISMEKVETVLLAFAALTRREGGGEVSLPHQGEAD